MCWLVSYRKRGGGGRVDFVGFAGVGLVRMGEGWRCREFVRMLLVMVNGKPMEWFKG